MCVDYAGVNPLPEVHRCIRAPVHLLWGEHDAKFPVNWCLSSPRLPTLSSVQRLPGKLLVHDEQPAAYAARIGDAAVHA